MRVRALPLKKQPAKSAPFFFMSGDWFGSLVECPSLLGALLKLRPVEVEIW